MYVMEDVKEQYILQEVLSTWLGVGDQCLVSAVHGG